MPGAARRRSTAVSASWSAIKLLGLDAAEKVEHSGDLVINLRSVDMGVRMSDEVPFTAINSRFLQVFKENPDARELVFYGGSGSSKSTSVAQILLKQFLDTKQPPVRMLFSGNGCPR